MPRNNGKRPSGFNPSQKGVNRGQKPHSVNIYQGVTATGMDGTKLISFPTYEPLFLNRPKVFQVETQSVSCDSCCTGTVQFAMNSALGNNFTNCYTVLLDNIASAYANAQGLTLTTATDFANYCNTWFVAAAGYIALISIINGDGFNERVTSLAQVLTTRRSRIQTGYDRLASIPIPPGFIDLVYRSFGLFANDKGDDCYLNIMNTAATGVPLDLTNGTNVDTLLTQYETALVGLAGAVNESGLVRIVLSEFYGGPSPLPYPGVRLSRALYNQFRLMATQFLAATNVFGGPYIQTGTAVPTNGHNIPLLIPQGFEDDPWWMSYYRFNPYMSFNNVVKANAQFIGLFNQSTVGSTGDRIYIQGSATTAAESVSSGVLDGFTLALNELYFAPYAASSTIGGYATDTRTQNDFTVITANQDIIANETINMQTKLVAGKQRLAAVAGLTEYSSMKRSSIRV